jgi:hypothetical protein
MALKNIEQARKSIVTRPVVSSSAAAVKLAASMRRLGADEATVLKLTGQRPGSVPSR